MTMFYVSIGVIVFLGSLVLLSKGKLPKAHYRAKIVNKTWGSTESLLQEPESVNIVTLSLTKEIGTSLYPDAVGKTFDVQIKEKHDKDFILDDEIEVCLIRFISPDGTVMDSIELHEPYKSLNA